MGILDKTFDVTSAKKKIDKRMTDLNNRLMTAKNNFELVVVYNDIEEIIESEINLWLNSRSGNTLVTSIVAKEHDNFVALEVDKLRIFKKKVTDMKVEILPSAIIIQSTLIREHKLKEPKIQIETK